MPGGKGIIDSVNAAWDEAPSLDAVGENELFCSTEGLKLNCARKIPVPMTIRRNKMARLEIVCCRLCFLFSLITFKSIGDLRGFGKGLIL